MRCSNCGQHFSLGGDSSAPGVFLVAGGIAAMIGVTLFIVSDSFAAQACASIALVFAAALFFGIVPVAMDDGRGRDFDPSEKCNRRCPNCQKPNRIRPWSF